MSTKPLGRKSYGSIGHLLGSRVGPGDHHVHVGQHRCMTQQLPKGDRLIVQEKLDGTNVGVCKVDGKIHAIGRAGWLAASSPYRHVNMFSEWVEANRARFEALLLSDGDRVCGEWLAAVHGTVYELEHEPFVAFDYFNGRDERMLHDDFVDLLMMKYEFTTPHVFHNAEEACAIEKVADAPSKHGALLGTTASPGPKEGVVYRWERSREGRVIMLAKWVRPDKIDSLPVTGAETWNSWPKEDACEDGGCRYG